jgi:hypothetical protein
MSYVDLRIEWDYFLHFLPARRIDGSDTVEPVGLAPFAC